jgi:hypothetical protein
LGAIQGAAHIQIEIPKKHYTGASLAIKKWAYDGKNKRGEQKYDNRVRNMAVRMYLNNWGF